MNCKRCNGTGEEPDQEAIGWQMRISREDAGISLRKMAKLCRVSHAFLSLLESGQRTWRPCMISTYKKQTTK